MATTPPPRSARALTPPTPLHGPIHDSPRRSSRIHSRTKYSPSPLPQLPASNRKRPARPNSSQTLSPPSSPISPNPRSSLHRNHKLARLQSDEDPLTSAPRSHTGDLEPGMLPTPSKTPRKRAHRADAPTARLLFQPAQAREDLDDLMPTPKKSRVGKKNLAFTLESFEAAEANGASEVHIYTDSKERLPEVDEHEDNPFTASAAKGKAGEAVQPEAPRSKPKRTYGLGDEIDRAVQNDEGMVFTFRGRKIYRPFKDADEEGGSEGDDELGEGITEQRMLRHQAGGAAQRPLTRSAVKPRVLFPPQTDNDSVDDLAAEEAETDIEGHHGAAGMQAEADDEDEISATTPVKTHAFQPMTPPTTTRKKKTSPFDSWLRTKAPGRGAGGKRASEPMEREGGAHAKRSRNGQVEGQLP